MPFIAMLAYLFLAGSPASTIHLSYTVRIDPADFSTFGVRMQVLGEPAEFTIAAAAHSEYDDKYWHYLEGIAVDHGTVERIDSVRWRVYAPAGNAVISYRIRPPAVSGLRAAWRAYLTLDGGLTGGPHTFLYVIGAERAPARVTLDLPPGWRIATGLAPASAPRTYTARDMAQLLDSPILVGPHLSMSSFQVGGVPHEIVYWGTPAGVPFDTAAFRAGIERLVRTIVAFWGSMPYRRYTFLFEDGAFRGGLEHRNSVTLGAESAELARDPLAVIGEVAHEFFHTWNLMTIRPAEYRDVDYRVQPPVAELWFSEGLTIFYADLLARRAGLPTAHPTREDRLASLLARYLGNSGYGRHSAETISRTAYNAPSGALGDFSGSTHLQGEVIGAMLDLIVRNATGGARSMDDVMRLLLARPSSQRVRREEVEDAVATVCRCAVHAFFDAHVQGAAPIDPARYLAPLGLRTVVTSAPATTTAGQPAVDLRVRGVQDAPDDTLQLFFWDPSAAWVRAGLHTNDRLLAFNGERSATWEAFRARLARLRIGDTVEVEVLRDGAPRRAAFTASGYEVLSVRIEEVAGATERQQRLRAAWREGR